MSEGAGMGAAAADTSIPVCSMLLPPNQIERFYAGGARIDRLRGHENSGGGAEDWVGSTTTTFGDDHRGLSRLSDGRVLRDAIEADPEGFLGAEHVQRFGPDPALLVKLLDAGERLPVHFHPGRRFAREELGLAFGKTEAWIIVSADPEAVVHVGLRAGVEAATVSRWVREQDVAAMLAAMHQLPVTTGQVVFVPAGTLHAIGAGILLVELQEPTDLSALLEWQSFGVNSGVEHLRLGWPRALEAMDVTAAVPQSLVRNAPDKSDGVQELFPAVAAPYFRAQRISASEKAIHLDQSFAILIVLDGGATLLSERGDELELRGGETALVPHAAGTTTLDGRVSVIRCLPPALHTGSGQW
jgi:mannose-6-phosphate isomerase